MKCCYDYPRPAVTVDAALLVNESGQWYVLLIRRKNDPFAGAWALPGGFVDENESVEEAMQREMMEETALRIESLQQFRVYSAPGRDPRGHTITVAFYACLSAFPQAVADDDAAGVGWFPLHSLPELAFDHAQIVSEMSQALLKNES